MSGRTPDYNLCVKRQDKQEEKFFQIGCGWKNERGGINLRLNVGVVLNWKECEGLFLMLFPNTKAKESAEREAS